MNVELDLLRSKRQPDGTWRLGNTHPERFTLYSSTMTARPSDWITRHALRVLEK